MKPRLSVPSSLAPLIPSRGIKPSEIIFHGRNVHGLSVFTCYSHDLGQYSTDARGREARRLARDYFIRLQKASA